MLFAHPLAVAFVDRIVQVGEEETPLAAELFNRVRYVLVNQIRIILMLVVIGARIDILLQLLLLLMGVLLLLLPLLLIVRRRDIHFKLAHLPAVYLPSRSD